MKPSVKNAIKAELREVIKDSNVLGWLNGKIDNEKQINFKNSPRGLGEAIRAMYPIMQKHPAFLDLFSKTVQSDFNVWASEKRGEAEGDRKAKNAMQESLSKKKGELQDREKKLEDAEAEAKAKRDKEMERGQSMRAIEKAYGPYLEEIAKQRLPDDMLRDALVNLAKEAKIPDSEKGQQLLEKMGNLVRAYETRNLQYNYLASVMQKDDSMRKYMNPNFMQEYTQGNFDYNPIDYRNQPVPMPYANYSYRPKQKKRWLTKRMYWQVSNMGF